MKMNNKVLEKIYIAGFMLMLVVPLLMLNRDEDAVSMKENRPLAHRPSIRTSEGGFNMAFPSRVEEYLNDRIGLRDQLILLNGKMQYHVFGRMEDGSRYRLGPEGEFNIIEGDMVETYQHKNLFDDAELAEITDSMVTVNDFVKSRGCDFYFVDCYDKQTVYPEYFPDSVRQYGEKSRTDQFMDALKEDTDINVIDLRDSFFPIKDSVELYSKYGDPVHWTPRGAFVGYTAIMNAINTGREDAFKVLGEEDFNITTTEQGMEFYGGVSHTNLSEAFELKSNDSVRIEDCTAVYPFVEGLGTYYYQNDKCGNDTRILILGNSFIYNYIIDYFAESFGETLMIKSGISEDIGQWIDEYDPDIVLYEVAERYTNYGNIVDVAKALK